MVFVTLRFATIRSRPTLTRNVRKGSTRHRQQEEKKNGGRNVPRHRAGVRYSAGGAPPTGDACYIKATFGRPDALSARTASATGDRPQLSQFAATIVPPLITCWRGARGAVHSHTHNRSARCVRCFRDRQGKHLRRQRPPKSHSPLGMGILKISVVVLALCCGIAVSWRRRAFPTRGALLIGPGRCCCCSVV